MTTIADIQWYNRKDYSKINEKDSDLMKKTNKKH
jgi:hypothetical protein